MFMIFVSVFVFSFTICAAASESQARLAWSHVTEDILVEVHAPTQAYPGDAVPLSVRVNATADLRDVYVILWISGSRYENCTDWNATYFEVLYGARLDSGEAVYNEYDLEIPSDADPGLVYGHVVCKWMTLDLQDHSKYDSFSVTYLRNKVFEELESEHAEFENTYEELNASYIELKTKHEGEIGGTRNLMYLFVATTAFSAATAFVLLFRRPKRPWT